MRQCDLLCAFSLSCHLFPWNSTVWLWSETEIAAGCEPLSDLAFVLTCCTHLVLSWGPLLILFLHSYTFCFAVFHLATLIAFNSSWFQLAFITFMLPPSSIPLLSLSQPVTIILFLSAMQQNGGNLTLTAIVSKWLIEVQLLSKIVARKEDISFHSMCWNIIESRVHQRLGQLPYCKKVLGLYFGLYFSLWLSHYAASNNRFVGGKWRCHVTNYCILQNPTLALLDK